MPLALLTQYPSVHGALSGSCLSRQYVCVVILLMLLPDIPLSSLEGKKSEHIQLLQDRISQLKQQMAGDCKPPGNKSNTIKDYSCFFKATFTYS